MTGKCLEGEAGKGVMCYEFVHGNDTSRNEEDGDIFACNIFSQKNISNAIIKILEDFLTVI